MTTLILHVSIFQSTLIEYVHMYNNTCMSTKYHLRSNQYVTHVVEYHTCNMSDLSSNVFLMLSQLDV